jgi:hypothetical protein
MVGLEASDLTQKTEACYRHVSGRIPVLRVNEIGGVAARAGRVLVTVCYLISAPSTKCAACLGVESANNAEVLRENFRNQPQVELWCAVSSHLYEVLTTDHARNVSP